MFDTVVIGAGVIGLAVARRLALENRAVLVVEKNSRPGEETSSHNSEVLHAGLYYPPGSLKARLCVAGHRQLIDYCRQRHVGHRLTGKLVVAVDGTGEEKLAAIRDNAARSGVSLPPLLTRRQARELEPAVDCQAALLSPGSGIIDSHSLMMALQADLENAGGMVVCRHSVESLAPVNGRWRLSIRNPDGQVSEMDTGLVINAAGLNAVEIASRVRAELPLPSPSPCRGNYFSYPGRLGIRHLIYPTPEPGGLGIHLTLDLDGQIRFGPDVEYLPAATAPDYRVNTARKADFVRAIRRYLPDIDADRLVPAYAGIRPKVSIGGKIATDFIVQNGADQGLDGLINLFGIESPGLTACLAIADHVTGIARGV